ncbi:sensor histidine kinase [Alkalihalobacillus sp. TS-13]|uniref:sensor histidine kinase n=1 Tax=Alkalihalobacillus sp. TS-13 TaxID=2842455 RepID=UPI001C87F4B6|nr:sensor histidine kinase [Alkalihalobacillus sp. TS-13]
MNLLRWGKLRLFPKRFGMFPYIFLVYMLIPVLMMRSEVGMKAILGYAMIALFLVSYRQLFYSIYKNSRYFTFWLSVQLSIIFIFSLFYQPDYLFLGFYPAIFIGWYPKKKPFYTGLAMLFIIQVVPVLYHTFQETNPYNLGYIFPSIIILLLSPFGFRSIRKRIDLEQQLQQANAKINEYAAREERMRIARDLHDTLGHTLSLITLKSQLVGRVASIDPERARSEAKEIENTSRAALKQVRELVSDMRTVKLTDELVEIRRILQAAGIDFDLIHHDGVEDIPPLTQNILSMCLKEATTNVIKHSGAANCLITIKHSTTELTVTVKDDGIGLDEENSNGNGLKGMKERLELIDGNLTITGRNGTVVEMKVPLVRKSEKAGAGL